MRSRIILLLAVTAASTISTLAFAEGPASVWDGVFTTAQADRGKQVFSETCAPCHGEGLAGGEMAPALAGSTFQDNWNGQALKDLFARMRTMPPTDPGGIPRDKTSEVLAYVLSVNGYPAGQTELSSVNSALETINITSKK
jgi:S-disulfanyl-L-cysteine oxidoreductase SoxD